MGIGRRILKNATTGRRGVAVALAFCLNWQTGWGVEVLKLPDGSWIGPPEMVEASPVPPRSDSPFETYRTITNRFTTVIGEEASLMRRLFEVLPAALQKTIKTPPAVPAKRSFDSPVDRALVFPTGGGWPVTKSRYAYAFADAAGNIGEGMDDMLKDQVGVLAFMPALLPRLSPEVTLLAWELEEGKYRADFSQAPLAKMAFANPLHVKHPTAPLWPDGTKELERTWRGRTILLDEATRVLHEFEERDKKKKKAGISFDLLVKGARTAKEFNDLEWFLEDNRGNFYKPSGRGWSTMSGSDGLNLSHSSSEAALWPENPNWRLTLVFRPTSLTMMTPNEYRRIRINHPRGKVENQVIEQSLEINGATLTHLRIAPDPQPPHSDQPDIDQWYVPAVIEFEVASAAPGAFVEASYFYDGLAPFSDRHQMISKPHPTTRAGTKARIPVALDKEAEFLEFVISVTQEERLEFYFQPKLLP